MLKSMTNSFKLGYAGSKHVKYQRITYIVGKDCTVVSPVFDVSRYKQLLMKGVLYQDDYDELRAMTPPETYFAIQDTADPTSRFIDVKARGELGRNRFRWGHMKYSRVVNLGMSSAMYVIRSNMSIFGRRYGDDTDPYVRVIDAKDYNEYLYRARISALGTRGE